MFGYSRYYHKYMAQKIVPVWKEIIIYLWHLGIEEDIWENVRKYFESFNNNDSLK
jgi:hypothetical protein